MRSGGWEVAVSLGTEGDLGTVGVVADGDIVVEVVFGRLARGELGREGGARCGELEGGGVDDLVMP